MLKYNVLNPIECKCITLHAKKCELKLGKYNALIINLDAKKSLEFASEIPKSIEHYAGMSKKIIPNGKQQTFLLKEYVEILEILKKNANSNEEELPDLSIARLLRIKDVVTGDIVENRLLKNPYINFHINNMKILKCKNLPKYTLILPELQKNTVITRISLRKQKPTGIIPIKLWLSQNSKSLIKKLYN